MDKQPQLPGSRAKDVMCKRWDTPGFSERWNYPFSEGTRPRAAVC
jgi:hypothetical protein